MEQFDSDRDAFARSVGEALKDIGFFAITNHGVSPDLLERSYAAAREFFSNSENDKKQFHGAKAEGQRGFTPFGVEHAKDSDAPDLKEFYQVGRPDVSDDHPVHAKYGPNIWPDAIAPSFRDTFTELYRAMDALGAKLLRACALYLSESENLFADMATDSDTIIRVIHYPALDKAPPKGSVRAAAHEDINLITLLPSSTADGLELLDHDGNWLPIRAGASDIIADSGDMLQNLTNGLLKSTTHRVVNPDDTASDRFSLPCFIHARTEIDLSPLPSCVEKTGGKVKFDRLTAGEYLTKRLREIGLA